MAKNCTFGDWATAQGDFVKYNLTMLFLWADSEASLNSLIKSSKTCDSQHVSLQDHNFGIILLLCHHQMNLLNNASWRDEGMENIPDWIHVAKNST